MDFGGFGFKLPSLWVDPPGLFRLWLRPAFVLAGEGVAMPFLDARLAVGAEADFRNAVASAGSGFSGVELLRTKGLGLASELFRGSEGIGFARTEFARSTTFRVEGFRTAGLCTVGTGTWPEGTSAGGWARGGGTSEAAWARTV
jgi:hypothetical protein